VPLEGAAHETARLSEAGLPFGEREEELPRALVEAVGAENVPRRAGSARG
jgi:hypothetical protein